MPRSGTTLVEQILSGHSEVFGAGELGVIPRIIQGLNRWERHVGSGRAYPDCIDDLTPYVTAGIADNVLNELKEFDPEARHIVDKLPHNFGNIDHQVLVSKAKSSLSAAIPGISRSPITSPITRPGTAA
jgi:hypothetical protein